MYLGKDTSSDKQFQKANIELCETRDNINKYVLHIFRVGLDRGLHGLIQTNRRALHEL